MIRVITAAAAIAAATVSHPAEAKGLIAVVTRDAAPLAAWYAKAFDVAVVRSFRPAGRDIDVTILDGPHVTIEIQQSADAIQPAERANRRTGIAKVGFQVPAIEPLLARWKAMGATIIAGPFDDALPPMRSVVLLDPDGNSIHVMTPLAK